MSDRQSAGESGGSDPLRFWIEAHRALFEATGAGPAWLRAERVHRAWAAFAETLARTRAEAAAAPGASPFDPAGWLRPAGAGGMADLLRWLEGPEFADLWAEERRAIRTTREWVAWLAATEQMKAVLGEAWLAAFRRFVERLGAQCPADAPSWSGILALWQEAAEAETTRLYRSPTWLAASRDLIGADIALRRSLRERIEQFAGLFGLPTRREIDDLHATVHRLRREVRSLRAALRPAAAGAPGRGP